MLFLYFFMYIVLVQIEGEVFNFSLNNWHERAMNVREASEVCKDSNDQILWRSVPLPTSQGIWREDIETLCSAQLPVNQTGKLLKDYRRILRGREVGDTRPYMVYLMPAYGEKEYADKNWLCGGAIIDPLYIITSAACIEQVEHFYVISGTHRWSPFTDTNNECIKNGRKKAVWKCVHKSYVFDGKEFDNILWLAHDLAVVKVEDDFNFEKRVKGCDFIPKMIAYNNVSADMEKPGTMGSIAGWGATEKFYEANKRTANSPKLLEADVQLMSLKNCKKRWPERYHHIIQDNMVCAKSGRDGDDMSEICKLLRESEQIIQDNKANSGREAYDMSDIYEDQEVNCKDMIDNEDYDTEEQEKKETRYRKHMDLNNMIVHSAAHTETRRTKPSLGGFCENDHGGPLVVGLGTTATVVGIISACLTDELTQKCHGPYLYTSVWKNRHLINCAINKNMGDTCLRVLRTSNKGEKRVIKTEYNWDRHLDGPAKYDLT